MTKLTPVQVRALRAWGDCDAKTPRAMEVAPIVADALITKGLLRVSSWHSTMKINRSSLCITPAGRAALAAHEGETK